MTAVADWHPLYTVIAGVPVALLTSWVTVKLAIGRYQSEKWFERRIDAYTRVIESLHHMKQMTQRQLRAEEEGIELDSESENELGAMYKRGLADLQRLTDMGALVFASDAIDVLDQLNKDLAAALNEHSWWEHLDAEAAAINKCLPRIREIAKRELRA
jgi:hypothetical protein